MYMYMFMYIMYVHAMYVHVHVHMHECMEGWMDRWMEGYLCTFYYDFISHATNLQAFTDTSLATPNSLQSPLQECQITLSVRYLDKSFLWHVFLY